MSQIKLSSNPSGTGIFTLESPATNTNRTLTLPDEAGTVITTAGVPKAALPAGSVLQVVQATYSTYTTTTSTSFQDSGLSASITPTSSSSKVLVLVTCFVGKFDADYGVNVRLVRDSTAISTFVNGAAQNDSSTRNMNIGVSHNYVDSPATTSSTTYKIQFCNDGGASGSVAFNWYFNSQTTTSTLTLMEIAA